MSKRIHLTPEDIEEIKADFEKALTGAISDGRINFQKTFGTIQRKAELFFTEIAWYKMQTLIRECDKEVGWHGVAKRVDEPEKDAYIIEDILVYPQEVTGTTVNPDQNQYQMWLMSHSDEIFNNIRMQGHSHVNMSVSPSGVDTTFYEQILRQLDDTMFYIFMIWNKRNERHIKIYDMAKNVLFETSDVTVSVIPDENGIEKFLSEAKKMITERKPPVYQPGSYSSGYSAPNNYGGYGGSYGSYKPNEPTHTPVTATPPATSPAKAAESAAKTVLYSGKENADDSKKKKGKKHRVGDGRKKTTGASLKNIYTGRSESPEWGSNHCDDDDPYGPFGYREYYGYED